jgi:uncharacterized protein YfaQ (DUF2300 family)
MGEFEEETRKGAGEKGGKTRRAHRATQRRMPSPSDVRSILSSIVRAADGTPVTEAQARVRQGGMAYVVDEDGSIVMIALSPGRYEQLLRGSGNE